MLFRHYCTVVPLEHGVAPRQRERRWLWATPRFQGLQRVPGHSDVQRLGWALVSPLFGFDFNFDRDSQLQSCASSTFPRALD